MGYYTKFELNVIAKNREARDQMDTLHVDAGATIIDYLSVADLLEGNADATKWYSWEKDMQEFSKKYPLLIFQLDGVGQEGEFDIWRAFFKNGKSFTQEAELKFEKPDFSRLD